MSSCMGGHKPATQPYVLAVNSAEERLQIVLGQGRNLLESRGIHAPGRAMQFLAPAIDSLLRDHGVESGLIGRIGCVTGPGSFTGLRLSLATIFGLSRGWGTPMGAIEYLPLLAAGPGPLLTGELWVVTHARQGQVYLQPFSLPTLAPLSPPISPRLAEIRVLLDRIENPVTALGSGIRRNAEFWENTPCTLLEPVWDTPLPSKLLDAACQVPCSFKPLTPYYLRPSDAEENLQKICETRGISLQEARKQIPDFLA